MSDVESDSSIDDTTLVNVKVVSALRDLESDFSCLMTDTRQDLEDCDIEEIKFYLDDNFGVDEFRQCKNIVEVLRKLRRDHVGTFNIRDLKHLVNRFHQSEAIVKKVEEYEEKKEEFLRTTAVKEFQQAVVSKSETLTRGMAAVRFRIPEEYNIPRTMMDVEELAKRGFKGHRKKMHVDPGNWSLSSDEEILSKQKGENVVMVYYCCQLVFEIQIINESV